jgi:hypothetical protein
MTVFPTEGKTDTTALIEAEWQAVLNTPTEHNF